MIMRKSSYDLNSFFLGFKNTEAEGEMTYEIAYSRTGCEPMVRFNVRKEFENFKVDTESYNFFLCSFGSSTYEIFTWL